MTQLFAIILSMTVIFAIIAIISLSVAVVVYADYRRLKKTIERNLDSFDHLDDRLPTESPELIDPKKADPKLYRGWA